MTVTDDDNERAHFVAMQWMPDGAPDSGKVFALTAYIAIAIAAARRAAIEECAKVADDVSVKLHEQRHQDGHGYNDSLRMSDGAQEAADAIRATMDPAG